MAEDHQAPPTPTTDPKARPSVDGLGSTLSRTKMFGAVLNAAFDDCSCRSCEVLRDIGRDLAGAFSADGDAKESPS